MIDWGNMIFTREQRQVSAALEAQQAANEKATAHYNLAMNWPNILFGSIADYRSGGRPTLDERFSDFKIRLAAARKKRGMTP